LETPALRGERGRSPRSSHIRCEEVPRPTQKERPPFPRGPRALPKRPRLGPGRRLPSRPRPLEGVPAPLLPAGGRLWRASEVDLLVHARIENPRPEREASGPSSDRGLHPPGGDFRSRGCAAARQVGVKIQKRPLGLSHYRSFLAEPRGCLRATEPYTWRPPHRPGPERAGHDRQPPQILRPAHRSAGVGVLSPRHPSRNHERGRHAFPHPLPCSAGWRSLLQQLGLEFRLRKGQHPRTAHAMHVVAARFSAFPAWSPAVS
ncbi:hypothetical protein P7K49_012085, partial [Saguinus oedipus]